MPNLIKPMLRVNGVPILLSAAQQPQVSYDEAAMVTDRSARGVLVPSRRNLTRALTAKTAPYTWPDAHAIKALVEGQGAGTGFDSSPFYINRALAPTVTGAPTTTSGFYISAPSALSMPSGASLVWSNLNIGAWLASSLGCTISFWLRQTSDAAFPLATLTKSGSADSGLVLARTTGGGLTWSYSGVAGLTGSLAVGSDWHMVTAVARDTSMSRYATASLYVDGQLQAAGGAALTGFAYPNRDTLTLGAVQGGTVMFDDMVVYPFPLTDAQVAGMYLSQTVNAGSSAGAQSATPGEVQAARYLPQVWVSGDGIGDAMLAVGRVTGTQLQAVHRDPITSELLVNGMTLDLAFFEAGAPR